MPASLHHWPLPRLCTGESLPLWLEEEYEEQLQYEESLSELLVWLLRPTNCLGWSRDRLFLAPGTLSLSHPAEDPSRLNPCRMYLLLLVEAPEAPPSLSNFCHFLPIPLSFWCFLASSSLCLRFSISCCSHLLPESALLLYEPESRKFFLGLVKMAVRPRSSYMTTAEVAEAFFPGCLSLW